MVNNTPQRWDAKNKSWVKLVLRGMTRENGEEITEWCKSNTRYEWMYHPVVYAYHENSKSGYICYRFENKDDAFAFKLRWSRNF